MTKKNKGWHGESRRHAEAARGRRTTTEEPRTATQSPEDYYINHYGETAGYEESMVQNRILDTYDLDNVHEEEAGAINFANQNNIPFVYAIPIFLDDGDVKIYYTATRTPNEMPDNAWRVQ